MAWNVFFFQTARGECPVKDFADRQDAGTKAKIDLSIRLLFNQGPFLKPPYVKKLQNKLYELRVSATVQVRIFYAIYGGEYYLLHAFVKKTQKTPIKEIKIAISRMRRIS